MSKNGVPRFEIVADGSQATANASPSKLICGRFDKAVRRQMRELAARQDTTLQELIAQALNLLFAEYGLPRIAK
jgi:hypothetical protein